MHPEQQLLDLSGKVAVITGGSRGLGRQMADAFARSGAEVMIASRKLDQCEAAAAEITAATGQRAEAFECHVGKWEHCDALFEATYDQFGHCDILVNNAGMSPLYGKLTDVTEELFDKVLQVNLRGPFRLCALFGERMAEGDGGSIINVSSTASLVTSPNETAYGAAKAGVNALTGSFAHAYAPKVRVNTIMPGPFATDIADAWTDETKERIARDVPLNRIGAPDEIVGAAMYLASDASSYTTGATIKIDGGVAWQ
jgi:NAD(P)-dependent dehydrogenase (short-subunit alcohol dehydrogenase family)